MAIRRLEGRIMFHRVNFLRSPLQSKVREDSGTCAEVEDNLPLNLRADDLTVVIEPSSILEHDEVPAGQFERHLRKLFRYVFRGDLK